MRIARETVSRWEAGQQRPEDVHLVALFARIVQVDLDEALAAAGLRPSAEPPTTPATQTLPPDPAIARLRELLEDPKVPPHIKDSIRNSLNALVDLARERDSEPAERRQAA